MKYVLLVSHGKFAEGLKTSLEMFTGDTERIFAIGLHNGKSADDFKQEVKSLLDQHKFSADDEFVILADLIGGSPLTSFLSVAADYELARPGNDLGRDELHHGFDSCCFLGWNGPGDIGGYCLE